VSRAQDGRNSAAPRNHSLQEINAIPEETARPPAAPTNEADAGPGPTLHGVWHDARASRADHRRLRPTLSAYYKQELEVGALVASYKVKTNLFRLACRQDFKAIKAIELWLRLIEHASEYAPAPIGKKVAAQLAAEEAPSEDSSWAGLLN
jgi:hypothetical protein